MKELIDKISLREILKSFIPALYLIVFIVPALKEFYPLRDIDIESFNIYNLLLLLIFTLIIGITISSLDLPKLFPPFKKLFPTEILKEEQKSKTKTDIHIKYFKFYDDVITDADKAITEKYTSYYHFSFNLAINSLILLIVYAIIFRCNLIYNYGFFILLTLGLSIVCVSVLLYGNKGIKYRFNRHLKSFKKYTTLED